jgi:plasmid segregation protein ParM
MVIKGLDVGYSYTKDNAGRIFKSAFSYYDQSVTGTKKLTIDGKDYYVGFGGMTCDVDKTNSEMNKVCTIYNIVTSGAKDILFILGLPIGQVKEQKEKLRESVYSYNKCNVQYDNKPYNFKIHDVYIGQQGVASLYTLKELYGEYIVIDIGGFTIDSCLVEFGLDGSRILEKDTWYKGMRTLYSSIIGMVNNHFNLSLDVSYAEKILREGLKIHGIPQDLSIIKPLLQEYVDYITNEIQIKYPSETVPIYLTGGGTDLLYKVLCKRFKDVHKIDNPQFANAIGYYNMGYFKFAQRGVISG